MKKKILTTFFMTFFALSLVTGCKQNVGTPEDNAVVETEDTEEAQGYVFGYSCIDMDNDYFEALGRSMETVLDDAGTIIVKDADSDAALQEEQIQELIEMEVDAVFLCPVDWKEITASLEALKDAGIPVINIDTQVKDIELVDAYIGSNNRNAGIVCGEDLTDRLPDGGKILIFECTDRNSIIERINGFEKEIANAGFEVLSRADGKGDKETAKEMMAGFLAEFPEIDAVMCGNDTMALGVMEAVKEAGREGVLIYGIDGSPDIKSAIAEGSVTATGAQSPINMGADAIEVALAIINGEEYNNSIKENTFLINIENIELYGIDGWQ